MIPWAFVSLAAAVGAAAAGRFLLTKRARHRQMITAKLAKLEELAKGGFQFSRQYDTGKALLLVDEPAGQWVLVNDDDPASARPRPFSEIQDCYPISGSKRHGGVRRINEAAMLRGSLGAANREVYQTEIMSGLVIRLQTAGEGNLFVDCLDSQYSAEHLQTTLLALKERANTEKETLD